MGLLTSGLFIQPLQIFHAMTGCTGNEMGVLRAAEWYYGPQEWLQTNLQMDKVGNGRFYDEAKLTAAYQYFEESRQRPGLR